MNDWFEWNGKRCTEYGIHVSEQPPLTLPAERVTFTDVPGRSGSLTTLEGEDVYEDMVLTAQCFIQSSARVPEIAGWLRGSGTVTFANRPGGFYHARVVNQIPFEKILRCAQDDKGVLRMKKAGLLQGNATAPLVKVLFSARRRPQPGGWARCRWNRW